MKISVAWLGVIALVAIVVFFSYQIATVAQGQVQPSQQQQRQQREQMMQRPSQEPHFLAPEPVVEAPPVAAPVVHKAPTNPVPSVPGQTAEDLTMDEPLRATPPAKKYDPPDATDPLNRVAFQDAEFGSNLRHPEQMIEKRPRPTPPSLASGIASERSSPGGNNAQGYSTEMVQNGATYMGSVLAFDGSEEGTAYSLI
jgi:hypothetical protein